ncbi:MAG: hypothetical protein CMD39_04915 [Gammaproteobacteria bacterium]|nr:hypothetical protein [Gammaproteobacteria bacterium]|tara:strand:- start:2746 stop:3294 length:549 start_codon:yes stop_codon:yes gene_type:complete
MAQRGGPTIDLYLPPAPAARSITIMLAECGLACAVQPPDATHTADLEPPLATLSRDHGVPALVDHETGVHVFDGGAILQYLGEKTGRFLPVDPDGRYAVLQWVYWQAGADQADLAHLGVLDAILQQREHLAGDYSIADMAWLATVAGTADHARTLQPFPGVHAWFERLRHRAGVRRGLDARA